MKWFTRRNLEWFMTEELKLERFGLGDVADVWNEEFELGDKYLFEDRILKKVNKLVK